MGGEKLAGGGPVNFAVAVLEAAKMAGVGSNPLVPARAFEKLGDTLNGKDRASAEMCYRDALRFYNCAHRIACDRNSLRKIAEVSYKLGHYDSALLICRELIESNEKDKGALSLGAESALALVRGAERRVVLTYDIGGKPLLVGDDDCEPGALLEEARTYNLMLLLMKDLTPLQTVRAYVRDAEAYAREGDALTSTCGYKEAVGICNKELAAGRCTADLAREAVEACLKLCYYTPAAIWCGRVLALEPEDKDAALTKAYCEQVIRSRDGARRRSAKPRNNEERAPHGASADFSEASGSEEGYEFK